jgi:DNA replication and repair protein RecF
VRVERLRLVSFRNYRDDSVELSGGLNLVVGANAQGKTNLLEALYCLGGLGSPRGNDAGLVRDGAERALLHADVVRGDRSLHIDLELRTGRGMRVLINKTQASGVRVLRDVVVAVFFGPDDLALVKGAPDLRRRWLDDLVVKLHPARESLRREWERVLRQRNALLKSAPRTGSRRSVNGTLAVWDETFCRLGGQVAAARLEALAALLPYAQKRYGAIAGGGRLELSYAGAWLPPSTGEGGVGEQALSDALAEKLEEVAPRELERGVSLVGPQRDDVEIRLAARDDDGNLRDARAFASQGDQRTIALACKIGEFDLLCDVLGEDPILLLDDVFSELDVARRSWLLDSVKSSDQTIVSSAESNLAFGDARVVRIEGGRINDRGQDE